MPVSMSMNLPVDEKTPWRVYTVVRSVRKDVTLLILFSLQSRQTTENEEKKSDVFNMYIFRYMCVCVFFSLLDKGLKLKKNSLDFYYSQLTFICCR